MNLKKVLPVNRLGWALLILGLFGLALFQFEQTTIPSLFAQTGPACNAPYLIDQTLPGGGRWQLCWNQQAKEGVTLTDIYYTPPGASSRKVMKEAGLAQIHVPYDDDSRRYHYVSDAGLGANNLKDLTAADCPGGALLGENGKNMLCLQTEARGHLYKYQSIQKQGYLLSLSSISQVGSQTFIVVWRLYDDGVIQPAIGHSGQLEAFGTNSQYGWPLDDNGKIGIGFTNNYYWRFDFDIGANGNNDIVEEFTVNSTNNGSNNQTSLTPLTTETGRSVDPQLKRSWRVRDATITNADGHAVSYHLEPLHTGHRYLGPSSEPWTVNDFYVTRYNSCERFISHNPTTGGCGADVTDFINGQNINGADVVVWYGVSFHRLPRDEDEPFMPTHWDSITWVPRDWQYQSSF